MGGGSAVGAIKDISFILHSTVHACVCIIGVEAPP